MNDLNIREYTPGDVEKISEIWQSVFSDSESTVDAVMGMLPDMGTALVWEHEGSVRGFALCLAGQELIYAGSLKKPIVGYIYAVAVEEEYRRMGAGSALVKAAAEEARRRGAGIIAALPAGESLYGWYEKLLGMRFVLKREEKTVECGDAEPTARLSSTEYMLWRDMLLRGKDCLHPSNYTMEAVRRFCESLGGGLYACLSGIAAGYTENGTAYIRELITAQPEDADIIAASVGRAMGADRAVYYVTAPEGDKYILCDRELPPHCVWNLSFD